MVVICKRSSLLSLNIRDSEKSFIAWALGRLDKS
jgi:hypothetical protein